MCGMDINLEDYEKVCVIVRLVVYYYNNLRS